MLTGTHGRTYINNHFRMKKLLILFSLVCSYFLFQSDLLAQVEKVRDDAAKQEILYLKERNDVLEIEVKELAAVTDSLIQQKQEIPDTFTIVAGDKVYKIPIVDGKIIVDVIQEIINQNEGNWPETPWGWATLIIGIIGAGKVTQLTTSAKQIYGWAKPLLKETLFIVVLVAAFFTTGITYLVAQSFVFDVFQQILPWVMLVAIFIYEKWVKPKKEIETAKA